MTPGIRLPLARGTRLAPTAALLAGLACLALALPAVAQTEGDCEGNTADPGLCYYGRFHVTVEWQDFSGNPYAIPGNAASGTGQGVVITPSSTNETDTGYFWFFTPDAAEVVVKVIDGTPVNGRFWVFAGSLTDVEYTIRVVDTQGSDQATYVNPPGQFSFIADTNAFPAIPTPKTGPLAPALAAPPSNHPAGTAPAFERRTVILPKESLPSCADPTVVCVQGGRIALQATAESPQDQTTLDAGPTEVTDTSAFLHFFSADGVDLVVKIVDGSSVNGELWVLASALAPLQTQLTVTDLQTGKSTTYSSNSPGAVLQVADRQPFAPDPPAGPWLTTPELPGFQFKVRITGPAGEIATRQEASCIPETLCISGAVPGRSELFLRVVGPKPNGFLQPNLVKFSTSQIEAWIQQLSTGQINYYELDPATPGSSDLTGFFDRYGFGPGPGSPL